MRPKLVTPAFLWEKFSERQLYKDLTWKTTFLERWSWFKFINIELALGVALKFNTRVKKGLTKGLKIKTRKFHELIFTFVEVTGEKLVRLGAFWPAQPE